jgi:N-acetylneuraminate synthase
MKRTKDSSEVLIIAEIGINHNGDINIAKELIDSAVLTGCDAVKFQKRTPELCVPEEYKDAMRETPWGMMSNLEYRKRVEFGEKEYDEIDAYCRNKDISWLASAWDIESQLFLRRYNCEFNKIASAMLTHKKLVESVADEGKHTFISTGMSTMKEIEKAVKIFRNHGCPFELMHCNSSYPMPDDQANLRIISLLRDEFKCKVGYSGHEAGLITTCAAVALGATTVERHITLDRAMWGTDQAASIEIMGFYKLVKYIRTIEKALGDGVKVVTPQEEKVRKRLRKINDL